MAELPPFYNKTFTWQRIYDFKYNITRALKFDFSATNMALLEEPQGKVDRRDSKANKDTIYSHWSDSVMQSVTSFGTNTDYRHQANLSWNLPLNKIDRKSTRLNSSHTDISRMPSSA